MSKAVAADPKQFNVVLAKKLGADFAINNGGSDLGMSELKEACGADGVDTSFVAASPVVLVNQSFQLVRKRGTVTLVGQFNEPGIVDIDKARLKEQVIVSSAAAHRKDFEEALEILAGHSNAFEPVIATEITLDETDDFIKAMIANSVDVAKAIVRLF